MQRHIDPDIELIRLLTKFGWNGHLVDVAPGGFDLGLAAGDEGRAMVRIGCCALLVRYAVSQAAQRMRCGGLQGLFF